MLDWPGALLDFQGAPLSEVADQLEQQFDSQVLLGDSSVGAIRVTGSFRDSTLKEVVGTVCKITGVTCGIMADTVVLGMPPKK